MLNKLWYIYNMEYYSTIKRDELLIHIKWIKSLDGSQGPYAKCQKPTSEGHIMHDSLYISFLKQQRYRDGEEFRGC